MQPASPPNTGPTMPAAYLTLTPTASSAEFAPVKTFTRDQLLDGVRLGRRLAVPDGGEAGAGDDAMYDTRVMSKDHAVLFLSDNQLMLRDCSSRNGTQLKPAPRTTTFTSRTNPSGALFYDAERYLAEGHFRLSAGESVALTDGDVLGFGASKLDPSTNITHHPVIVTLTLSDLAKSEIQARREGSEEMRRRGVGVGGEAAVGKRVPSGRFDLTILDLVSDTSSNSDSDDEEPQPASSQPSMSQYHAPPAPLPAGSAGVWAAPAAAQESLLGSPGREASVPLPFQLEGSPEIEILDFPREESVEPVQGRRREVDMDVGGMGFDMNGDFDLDALNGDMDVHGDGDMGLDIGMNDAVSIGDVAENAPAGARTAAIVISDDEGDREADGDDSGGEEEGDGEEEGVGEEEKVKTVPDFYDYGPESDEDMLEEEEEEMEEDEAPEVFPIYRHRPAARDVSEPIERRSGPRFMTATPSDSPEPMYRAARTQAGRPRAATVMEVYSDSDEEQEEREATEEQEERAPSDRQETPQSEEEEESLAESVDQEGVVEEYESEREVVVREATAESAAESEEHEEVVEEYQSERREIVREASEESEDQEEEVEEDQPGRRVFFRKEYVGEVAASEASDYTPVGTPMREIPVGGDGDEVMEYSSAHESEEEDVEKQHEEEEEQSEAEEEQNEDEESGSESDVIIQTPKKRRYVLSQADSDESMSDEESDQESEDNEEQESDYTAYQPKYRVRSPSSSPAIPGSPALLFGDSGDEETYSVVHPRSQKLKPKFNRSEAFKNPCKICDQVPSHWKSDCPVIIGGKESVVKRLRVLKRLVKGGATKYETGALSLEDWLAKLAKKTERQRNGGERVLKRRLRGQMKAVSPGLGKRHKGKGMEKVKKGTVVVQRKPEGIRSKTRHTDITTNGIFKKSTYKRKRSESVSSEVSDSSTESSSSSSSSSDSASDSSSASESDRKPTRTAQARLFTFVDSSDEEYESVPPVHAPKRAMVDRAISAQPSEEQDRPIAPMRKRTLQQAMEDLRRAQEEVERLRNVGKDNVAVDVGEQMDVGMQTPPQSRLFGEAEMEVVPQEVERENVEEEGEGEGQGEMMVENGVREEEEEKEVERPVKRRRLARDLGMAGAGVLFGATGVIAGLLWAA